MSSKQEADSENEDIDLKINMENHVSVLRIQDMDRAGIMRLFSNLSANNDIDNNNTSKQMPSLSPGIDNPDKTLISEDEWKMYKKLFTQNLGVGDFIDCNPIAAHHDGWRPAEIIQIDHRCREMKVEYVHNGQNKTYWFHFDDIKHISVFATKSMHKQHQAKTIKIETESVDNINKNKRRTIDDDDSLIDAPSAKRRKLNNWKSWNGNDIVEWIYNLEAHRFAKYIDKLSEIICVQEINGKDLKDIKEDHLEKWNIINFGDRIALFKHIQSLTSVHN